MSLDDFDLVLDCLNKYDDFYNGKQEKYTKVRDIKSIPEDESTLEFFI